MFNDAAQQPVAVLFMPFLTAGNDQLGTSLIIFVLAVTAVATLGAAIGLRCSDAVAHLITVLAGQERRLTSRHQQAGGNVEEINNGNS